MRKEQADERKKVNKLKRKFCKDRNVSKRNKKAYIFFASEMKILPTAINIMDVVGLEFEEFILRQMVSRTRMNLRY
jgi:hypothetical protein